MSFLKQHFEPMLKSIRNRGFKIQYLDETLPELDAYYDNCFSDLHPHMLRHSYGAILYEEESLSGEVYLHLVAYHCCLMQNNVVLLTSFRV